MWAFLNLSSTGTHWVEIMLDKFEAALSLRVGQVKQRPPDGYPGFAEG